MLIVVKKTGELAATQYHNTCFPSLRKQQVLQEKEKKNVVAD